ncbi:MAG: alpha/beta hydrolase [Planctomycetes bacterium]|nr:alpha/beta hydrolase [Planctomycetota bacterium]
MTPMPIPASHATSDAPRSRSISLAGRGKTPVTAELVELGHGKPVVFLHGLVGLNDHWEESARLVAPYAKCHLLEMPLLDLLGDDCSIDGVTELTANFLQRHVGEPAVVVGNSFGGHVALKIAIQRPELVRGLVLAGASGLIEKSIVSDVQIRPSREWVARKIGELFYDQTKMLQSDVDRAHEVLSHRRQARAMVKLSRSARRNHLGDEIGKIAAPTLIVWGRQDIVTPPEACEQFSRDIRGSRVVWLENCGHAPMIESPDRFGAALTEFVRELDSRPAAT